MGFTMNSIEVSFNLQFVLNKMPPNTACTQPPHEHRGYSIGVGVCAFYELFLGLKLVPSKQRYLVPPTSG
jgi:hypothetical protein